MVTRLEKNYYANVNQIKDAFFSGEEVSNMFKNKIQEDDTFKTEDRSLWSYGAAKELGEEVLIKLKDKLTESFPDSQCQLYIHYSIKDEKLYNRRKRISIYEDLLKNEDLCQELLDCKITWEKFLESSSIK
jgi:hypothetical protein